MNETKLTNDIADLMIEQLVESGDDLSEEEKVKALGIMLSGAECTLIALGYSLATISALWKTLDDKYESVKEN